jgi:cystathionine gamma-synthase/methionine-gamma-lyase
VTKEAFSSWQLATRLVHAGERNPAPAATPTATPIYTSATYSYPTLDALEAAFEGGAGYVYTRYGNPTVAAFEQAMAAAERGIGAVAYGSGMAALHAALMAAGTPRGETAPRPQSILVARDIYGTSMRLVEELFAGRGARMMCCDMCDEAGLDRAFAQAQPDVVLAEQLSNPSQRVIDVAGLARRARTAGARLVIDNTAATPVLQQPLTLGADLVVHSATKYLGGHGDAAGGVVVARSGLLRDTLVRHGRLVGASLGPFEAQQLLRGIKTLELRFARQCANALAVAHWLADQPAVGNVQYAGLEGHAQHALARQSFQGGFGALLTFDLRQEGRAALARFFEALQLIVPATSFGDVYSLATVPAITSHRDLTPAEQAERGIAPSTIRLSVGIEAPDDLMADLERGLAAAG